MTVPGANGPALGGRPYQPQTQSSPSARHETAPVSKIVAEARVNNIMDDTPAVIWDQVGDAGGITRDEFDRYFDGRSRAVAIWLSVRWLDVPVPLPDGMAPPQSWARYKGLWAIR